MKKFVIVLALISMAFVGVTQACQETIYGIQTGQTTNPASTLKPTCGIVTGIGADGFFIQEHPGAVDNLGVVANNPNGEYSGIWVYTGADPLSLYPLLEVGKYASVCGVQAEFGCLTVLDTVLADIYGWVLALPDEPVVALSPVVLTAAELAANGDVWESVMITISDGMYIDAGFDLGSGEWAVTALDGTPLIFDDFWYDFASVMEGHCYNNATGIYNCTTGEFKLEPFADGIDVTNCAVEQDPVSLGSIKAMYR